MGHHHRAQAQESRGQETQGQRETGLAFLPDEGQEEREGQVELFLHRQRPGVEKRLGPGFGIEVAAFLVEKDIGPQRGHGRQGVAEFDEIIRNEVHISRRAHRQGHHRQGRHDAAAAAFVEFHRAELAGPQVL
jgi:hypothetical protein